ncbi:MAG: aldehyde dehydrogenase family protein [Candidatus Omnitrophica bacterium]|nr:aldehyde dehydrogenase family protein [Candidatus Omnitrophota bacterium]MCB9721389.1 aldehyde dehydrogenase family protein [Candidatus Omnitrophota bacterium]
MTQTTGQTFDAINPATGQAFRTLPDANMEDAVAVIARARRAFDEGLWPGMSYAERGIYLKKIAQLIREHAKELADLEVADVGKTIKHANFIDVPTAADCFEYFSSVSVEDVENAVAAPVASRTVYEPRGVITAICAYNYPLIYAAWKIAPAIITGNTVILKPSPLAAATIHRLGELLPATGLPEGVVNVITTTSDEVAAKLVRCSKVDMVSFTGGTETGKKVMAEAAKKAKKVVLELGGKSPNIVFTDCRLEAALGGALSAIFINQGQMCTAGSRLFVQDELHDEFVKRLVERARTLKMGNPADAATEFGPLTSREHRDRLLQTIARAREEGATVACGGRAPNSEGYFLEPTILTGVTNDMAVAREECFGPVLSVIRFQTEEEAVAMANDSRYGLAGCVWTQDEQRASRVARALKAGTVWINTYGNFFNEAPFGGVKQSGFGCELGTEGLKEYVQAKHVCIDKTPGGMPLAASWF